MSWKYVSFSNEEAAFRGGIFVSGIRAKKKFLDFINIYSPQERAIILHKRHARVAGVSGRGFFL